MGLKMKNFNIMGVHQLLGEGITKKQYIGGIASKEDLDNLQGAWKKRGGRVFLRERVRVDTPMPTDLVLVHAGT